MVAVYRSLLEQLAEETTVQTLVNQGSLLYKVPWSEQRTFLDLSVFGSGGQIWRSADEVYGGDRDSGI